MPEISVELTGKWLLDMAEAGLHDMSVIDDTPLQGVCIAEPTSIELYVILLHQQPLYQDHFVSCKMASL